MVFTLEVIRPFGSTGPGCRGPATIRGMVSNIEPRQLTSRRIGTYITGWGWVDFLRPPSHNRALTCDIWFHPDINVLSNMDGRAHIAISSRVNEQGARNR